MATIKIEIPSDDERHDAVCTSEELGCVYNHNIEQALKDVCRLIRAEVARDPNAFITIKRGALLLMLVANLTGCAALKAYTECPPIELRPTYGGGYQILDTCPKR